MTDEQHSYYVNKIYQYIMGFDKKQDLLGVEILYHIMYNAIDFDGTIDKLETSTQIFKKMKEDKLIILASDKNKFNFDLYKIRLFLRKCKIKQIV